jgi:hypothetical protein
MDGPLYLDDRLDEPLKAFFQLMIIYTHLENHIEEPLEKLLSVICIDGTAEYST